MQDAKFHLQIRLFTDEARHVKQNSHSTVPSESTLLRKGTRLKVY